MDVFGEIWERYPDKSGKKQAERHFRASVKSQEDVDNIRRAVDNYLRSDRVLRGFVQNGATWFNNWRDWINPTPAMMGEKPDPQKLAIEAAIDKPRPRWCSKCLSNHMPGECP